MTNLTAFRPIMLMHEYVLTLFLVLLICEIHGITTLKSIVLSRRFEDLLLHCAAGNSLNILIGTLLKCTSVYGFLSILLN